MAFEQVVSVRLNTGKERLISPQVHALRSRSTWTGFCHHLTTNMAYVVASKALFPPRARPSVPKVACRLPRHLMHNVGHCPCCRQQRQGWCLLDDIEAKTRPKGRESSDCASSAEGLPQFALTDVGLDANAPRDAICAISYVNTLCVKRVAQCVCLGPVFVRACL